LCNLADGGERFLNVLRLQFQTRAAQDFFVLVEHGEETRENDLSLQREQQDCGLRSCGQRGALKQ
jgi:hypothetical protein